MIRIRRVPAGGPVLTLLVATVLLAGCRSTPTGAPSSPAASPSSAPTAVASSLPPVIPPVTPSSASSLSSPPPAVVPAPATGGGGPITAAGAGWSASGLDGPVPAPGSCRYRSAADGYALPDPGCTPGAVDPSVSQSDLSATICRSGGYTGSVRPPEALTGPFKRQSEAAYQDPDPSSATELDHLVPLELGGASDTRNLWPEPDQGRPAQFDPQDAFGINAKDGVESRLRSAVCDGQVTLAAAQQAIASDWTTALTRLGVAP